MGKIHFSTRVFYDSTCEYIGVKSGLLLSRYQVRSILLRHFNYSFLSHGDLDVHISLYSDEMDNLLLKIRQEIGNLPKILRTQADYKKIKDYFDKTGNYDLVARITGTTNHYIFENPRITNVELATLLEQKEGFPKEISLSAANIGIESSDLSCVLMPNSTNWDGVTKLCDLFECQILLHTFTNSMYSPISLSTSSNPA